MLLVPVLVGVACAVSGYKVFDRNRVMFDDAFITYRYAYNFAHGNGPVYNLGERVEGYTNFLWMLFAATGIKLGLDPLQVTRALGVTSHLLMLALIGWALCSWLLEGEGPVSDPKRWTRLFLLPVLSVLIAPASFAAMAGSGLESAFVAFLGTAAGALLAFARLEQRRARVALTCVLIAAVLTRLDGAAASAAAGVAILFAALPGRPRIEALRVAWSVLWPVGVVVVVWFAFRYFYYGELLPNTYYAKAADHIHAREGLSYLRKFARTQPQVVPLCIAAVMGVASSRPAVRRLALFALCLLGFEAAFTIKVGGDFMEYRFAWQQYGLLCLAAMAGISAIAERSTFSALGVIATAIALSGYPIKLDKRYTMQSIEEMNRYAEVGVEVGRKLGETLPPDTIIATTLAGTLAYYSKLTVIDMWGLNDHYTAHQPWKAKTLVRGHTKFSPHPYLEKRKVNLYINHPVICSCNSPCRERKPNIFVRLDKDRCMRSWYLTETPKLTQHVCAHPELFVLNLVNCPPQPPPSPPPPPPAPPTEAKAAPARTGAGTGMRAAQ